MDRLDVDQVRALVVSLEGSRRGTAAHNTQRWVEVHPRVVEEVVAVLRAVVERLTPGDHGTPYEWEDH